VICWHPLASASWIDPVGEFRKPIRNRAEFVKIHSRETDDMAIQSGKRKKDRARADATEAVSSLLRSQSALGAKFRRLRSKLGAPKAITAMAHMLARLVYRMLTFGHEHVDRGIELYETKYRQQQLQWVTKQAAALRMQLVPLTTVTD
jgi:hypothetical protein